MNSIHNALKDRSSKEFKDWVVFAAENDPRAARAIDQALHKIRNEQDARLIFDKAVGGQIDRDKAWADLRTLFGLVYSRCRRRRRA